MMTAQEHIEAAKRAAIKVAELHARADEHLDCEELYNCYSNAALEWGDDEEWHLREAERLQIPDEPCPPECPQGCPHRSECDIISREAELAELGTIPPTP